MIKTLWYLSIKILFLKLSPYALFFIIIPYIGKNLFDLFTFLFFIYLFTLIFIKFIYNKYNLFLLNNFTRQTKYNLIFKHNI